MGDIIGDLNKRRGQIQGMESKGNARVVKAKVPLSEMFGCVGRGTGPLTTAPVLFTVLTIFSADLSTRLWSKDFNLILIF